MLSKDAYTLDAVNPVESTRHLTSDSPGGNLMVIKFIQALVGEIPADGCPNGS